MIKVVILGQGLVATHFAVGLERLKNGEINDYGVPLRNRLSYRYEDIEIVASYDVDEAKVGKTVYEVACKVFPEDKVPKSLKDIVVNQGIHLSSLKGLPFKARGREEKSTVKEAIAELVDEWRKLDADVFINVITTEQATAFNDPKKLEEAVETGKLAASQAYAYAVALYAQKVKPAAFINAIPTPIANDSAFVDLYSNSRAVVFGDDGATGATPLTTDLLEHLYERNRYVLGIAQFNIGGNTDFLALDVPERNIMKKTTKSSIVRDILGYDVPNYIKPTGYLEPLGDKKFVAMIIEYLSFNEFKDEWYIVARINDSPALAGLLVDLVRLGKIAIDRESYGTVYNVNAFYMKKPGPKEARVVARTKAYELLLEWLGIYDERYVSAE
ncbi:MAG: myo-inositol-1-phosphate synthase [Thermoprotei archaeon]|nr:MAG: myo-inositol-1-phosphate synthase [Thermoprotei archaeon]